MSDWKSRAVPASNDWKSRAVASGAPAVTETPGMLDALMRGAEQGATFGFAPQILGGGSALLDALQGQDLSDSYSKNRDYYKALFNKTEEAHPILYGAGNLAGNVAAAIPLGAAGLAGEGVMGAATLGGVTGALQGASGSTANDLEGILKDVAAGGTLGALAGGAIGGVAKTIGPQIEDTVGNIYNKLKSGGSVLSDLETFGGIKDSFNKGLEGQRLFGKSGRAAANDEFLEAVNSTGDVLGGALDAAGKRKQDALNSTGNNIDLSTFAKDAFDMLKQAKENNPYAQDHADVDKIRALLSNYILGNEEAGITGKGLSVSPQDAENLLRKLGAMGSEGDNPLNTNLGKSLVNRMISPLSRDASSTESTFLNDKFVPLKTVLTDNVQDLGGANSDISQLLGARELLPSIGDVSNLSVIGKSGLSSTDKMNRFLGMLPEDLKNQIEPTLREASRTSKLANDMATPGLFSLQSASGKTYQGANAAGLLLNNATPDVLKQLSSHLLSLGSDAAKELSGIITQAAERDHLGRNALLFAIQQNPKYRSLLHDAVSGQ